MSIQSFEGLGVVRLQLSLETVLSVDLLYFWGVTATGLDYDLSIVYSLFKLNCLAMFVAW